MLQIDPFTQKFRQEIFYVSMYPTSLFLAVVINDFITL